jgi:UDP-N-acetylmuramoyl-tripeptide--D-alanyl-D-alanine ligase
MTNRLLARIPGVRRLGQFAVGIYRDRNWYRTRVHGHVAAALVRAYRPLLRNCEFIAVTGSCGKTTTKELIAGVLSSRWRGTKSPENLNLHYFIAVAMMKIRPGDRFSVQEVGIGKYQAGVIDVALDLIRPTIGVVTNIGTDHISSYGSREAIALEKSKVVKALPPTGTAVLNADDPLVLAMREHCRGRVLTYGVGQGSDVRAGSVSATWPARLSFTVFHGDQSERVETQLCGEHWVSSALAAIAVGLAMGMSLAEAASGLRAVPPFANRMCPVPRADGVTFVFDDAKSPLWTIPATFAFMRTAHARRRVIVMGTISDYTGSSERTYASVAKEAMRSADHVVFVGSRASKSLPARLAGIGTPLHAFYALDDARRHLAQFLEPDDLVLLKGIPNDHLGRICIPPPPAAEHPRAALPDAAASASPASTRWIQAVVGFGNHGEKYRHSPHNIGHEVVERLARFFAAEWVAEPEAHVATVPLTGGTLLLVKARTNVNDTGPALKALSARLGFGAEDCVLVHDDLNLEPGDVRARERGNDGGHQGARSVLTAFGTIAVRRVKVGVGRPAADATVQAHVLSPMSRERREIMDKAYRGAAERTLTLLAIPEAAHDELLALRARFAGGEPVPEDVNRAGERRATA